MSSSQLSVKDAKKILGSSAIDMTDKDIELLVERLNSLSRAYINMVRESV